MIFTNRPIERKDVIALCGISSQQGVRLLDKMVKTGKLLRKGTPPHGYSPACQDEWVRNVCNKPKVKCGEGCLH